MASAAQPAQDSKRRRFPAYRPGFEISRRPPLIIPATPVSAHHMLDANLGRKLSERATIACSAGSDRTIECG
jgi:hypothetical protein